MCGRAVLALGELRLLAGLLQTVLLALDHTGVAAQVAGALELAAVLVAGLEQRTGDAVTQRAGLAGDAAAVALRDDVEATRGLGDLERRLDEVDESLAAEELRAPVFLLTVMMPVPGTRRTRATEVLRRPVP